MIKYLKGALLTSGITFAMLPLAQAQNTLNAVVDISECMAIENSPLRYACYDALGEQVRQSAFGISSPAPSTAAPSLTAPRANTSEASTTNTVATASSRLESFGKEEGIQVTDIPASSSQSFESYTGEGFRVVTREDGEEELQDRIADLSRGPNDVWIITLEGGQVWQQTTPKRFNLRKGAQVRVYPSGWGTSYRLEMKNRAGFLQVSRRE